MEPLIIPNIESCSLSIGQSVCVCVCACVCACVRDLLFYVVFVVLVLSFMILTKVNNVTRPT